MESISKKKFWDLKPYWCQPWSIITFGILVLILSWKLFENLFLTSIFGFFIAIWWLLFLILVPISYEVNIKKK